MKNLMSLRADRLSASIACAIVVFAIAAFAVNPANAVTFTDPGTFSTPQWSETILGNGDVVDTRQSSGGNPGDFLQVQTIPNGGTIVAGFYANSAATWNPSTQGAIATVDLGIDVILLQGGGQGQGYTIGLEQGGMVFRSGFAATGGQLTWDSRTISGAAQSSFSLFNADGSTSAVNPDFSGAGGLITFGFIAANSGSSPASGTTAGYDNWSLTVNPVDPQVPEPGMLAVFGLGLAGLGLARRRRNG